MRSDHTRCPVSRRAGSLIQRGPCYATFFQLCGFGECPHAASLRAGVATDNHTNNRAVTARVVSDSKFNPKAWLNLTTTFGADYVNNESDYSSASSTKLSPGAQTVG